MIGWYVHHVGRGHLHHALATAARMRGPVTALSSLPRPSEWTADWVRLAIDDDGAVIEPAAHGALHWAPLGHHGLQVRMATIARWIAMARPRAMVVDLSVEVALLARVMGVPVVTFCLPGARTDAPHRRAWEVAEAIIAPWPKSLPQLCAGLEPFLGKVCFTGGISRFSDRPTSRPRRERHAVLLGGCGGSGPLTAPDVPDWHWSVLDGTRWCADPWPHLSASSVVVTHAGLAALADVAAARTPAVVVPQPRPFDEQTHTARGIRDEHLAIVTDTVPTDWARHLDDAIALGGSGWSRWSDGHGADRAARLIDAVAAGSGRAVPTCAS